MLSLNIELTDHSHSHFQYICWVHVYNTATCVCFRFTRYYNYKSARACMYIRKQGQEFEVCIWSNFAKQCHVGYFLRLFHNNYSNICRNWNPLSLFVIIIRCRQLMLITTELMVAIMITCQLSSILDCSRDYCNIYRLSYLHLNLHVFHHSLEDFPIAIYCF